MVTPLTEHVFYIAIVRHGDRADVISDEEKLRRLQQKKEKLKEKLDGTYTTCNYCNDTYTRTHLSPSVPDQWKWWLQNSVVNQCGISSRMTTANNVSLCHHDKGKGPSFHSLVGWHDPPLRSYFLACHPAANDVAVDVEINGHISSAMDAGTLAVSCGGPRTITDSLSNHSSTANGDTSLDVIRSTAGDTHASLTTGRTLYTRVEDHIVENTASKLLQYLQHDANGKRAVNEVNKLSFPLPVEFVVHSSPLQRCIQTSAILIREIFACMLIRPLMANAPMEASKDISKRQRTIPLCVSPSLHEWLGVGLFPVRPEYVYPSLRDCYKAANHDKGGDFQERLEAQHTREEQENLLEIPPFETRKEQECEEEEEDKTHNDENKGGNNDVRVDKTNATCIADGDLKHSYKSKTRRVGGARVSEMTVEVQHEHLAGYLTMVTRCLSSGIRPLETGGEEIANGNLSMEIDANKGNVRVDVAFHEKHQDTGIDTQSVIITTSAYDDNSISVGNREETQAGQDTLQIFPSPLQYPESRKEAEARLIRAVDDIILKAQESKTAIPGDISTQEAIVTVTDCTVQQCVETTTEDTFQITARPSSQCFIICTHQQLCKVAVNHICKHYVTSAENTRLRTGGTSNSTSSIDVYGNIHNPDIPTGSLSLFRFSSTPSAKSTPIIPPIESGARVRASSTPLCCEVITIGNR